MSEQEIRNRKLEAARQVFNKVLSRGGKLIDAWEKAHNVAFYETIPTCRYARQIADQLVQEVQS